MAVIARCGPRAAVLALCGLLLGGPAALGEELSDDLPPPGTAALFDRLVASAGGVPFPFERLLAAVAAAGDPAAPPVPVLIPDSRSLVRRENSFAMPRVLIAARGEPPAQPAGEAEGPAGGTASLPLLKDRLFVGYSEPIAQLEVISYNPEAGRFEFQLVDDYREGGSPRVTYARRAFCLGCHQSAAPIFPVRPWRESNAHAGIAEAIRAAREAGPDDRYHGAPLRIRLSDVEAFDDSVGAANRLLAAQAVWRDGCGGPDPRGPECRQRLLDRALDFALGPGLFDPGSPQVARLLELQAELWPSGGLALPDGRLLDRDPFAVKGRGWLARQLDSLGFGGEETADLPAELDPRSPRPPETLLRAPSVDGVYAVAAVFVEDDRRRLAAAAGDPGRRAAALAALASVQPPALFGPQPPALFGPGPLVRGALVSALLEALGAAPPAGPCCEADELLAEPRLAAVAPLELEPGSALEPFQRYCAGCHRGNPKERLDFMRGDTEREVWESLLAAPRLAEVLDWERYRDTPRARFLMPPWNSRERARIDSAIAEGDDVLAAMRRALAARGYSGR